jgi:hypothetical protein
MVEGSRMAFVDQPEPEGSATSSYIVCRDKGLIRRMAKPPLGSLYAIYHDGGDASRLQLVEWGSWRRG